ncbi:MAG: class I SAM-dependent methyltransferase [Patescibacteria group bacterium]|jgi:SAM-dependent methyltransferase
MQKLQTEWHWQWKRLEDDSKFLFSEWIFPYNLESFKDKTVIDAGCGGGQHTNFVAPLAKKIYAIDLNTTDLARERNKNFNNIEYIQDDLATVKVPEKADILFCIGVIQHTDNPDATFQNLLKQIKPGGSFLLWCYAKEGNALNEYLLEPIKRWVLLKLPKPLLLGLAHVLTILLYPIIYSLYLLPLGFLPYYEYFINWRKLPYGRNMLNVFDKLNAPQTFFIPKSKIESWFSPDIFDDVHIHHYAGVSWRASGKLKF